MHRRWETSLPPQRTRLQRGTAESIVSTTPQLGCRVNGGFWRGTGLSPITSTEKGFSTTDPISLGSRTHPLCLTKTWRRVGGVLRGRDEELPAKLSKWGLED